MAENATQKPIPPKAQGGEEKFTGEVTVEIGDDRNRNFLWAPTQDTLRGAWSRANLHSDELVEDLAKMPDLPGMRIHVDGRRRTRRIYDPLATKEFQTVRDEASRLIKSWQNTDQGPDRERSFEESTDGEIKTWLYWLRRLVDGVPVDTTRRPHRGGPQGKVVSGTLPSMEEIERMPGKTRISWSYEGTHKIKYREDFARQKEE